jgi:hypothetical protein
MSEAGSGVASGTGLLFYKDCGARSLQSGRCKRGGEGLLPAPSPPLLALTFHKTPHLQGHAPLHSLTPSEPTPYTFPGHRSSLSVAEALTSAAAVVLAWVRYEWAAQPCLAGNKTALAAPFVADTTL